MPPKKSSRAFLKEQGFERTDNDMEFSSWPQVNMINQKNYYTEYLKRDDQLLALRSQHEENRNRMARAARDKDRALANSPPNETAATEADIEMDDEMMAEDPSNTTGSPDTVGSNIIVIHPGSQNLRIGLASDALPKTVPMVIGRKSQYNESEGEDSEPAPKRMKLSDDAPVIPKKMIEDEFIAQYASMTTDLKVRMRNNKRRLMPNSKELVINYNRKSAPDIIPEHNDHLRIDWTELPQNPEEAPEYIAGRAALRIPDQSNPRYKLFWPMKSGWLNEIDYSNKDQILHDFTIIVEEAIKNELHLMRRKDWSQYGCVFIVPDLYDRIYVTLMLDLLLREFGFSRVCFIQESLSASFGAGYSTSCIVDIGAQKTSVCCVDEGMCVEPSRINLKFGGADVTEAYIRMLFVDQFPYADLNLNRRYDFLLAEELKEAHCSLSDGDVGVQSYEFSVRAFGQDTRSYQFKVWDAVICAPMGYFQPTIFDNTEKLRGRHKLIGRSYDLYDGSPNDPLSAAQAQALATSAQSAHGDDCAMSNGYEVQDSAATMSAPSRQTSLKPSRPIEREGTPRPCGVEDLQTRDERDTPQPARAATPTASGQDSSTFPMHPLMEMIHSAEERDRTLPIIPLDQAIVMSIEHGARGDERKMRDFFGGIMLIGGGAQFSNLNQYLEERLRQAKPNFLKEILIGPPPRDLDPQVLVWKGGSVFGKLRATNDSWISGMEYDLLGSRLIAHKAIWPW